MTGCEDLFHSYEYNRIRRYSAEAEISANEAQSASVEAGAMKEQLLQTNQKLEAVVSTLPAPKH